MKDLHRLLPIGRFAQRSRLSLKALRMYDQLGLLRPARVDVESGYRSYAESQLTRARRIALLRRRAMPLGTIQQVLDASRCRGAAPARTLLGRSGVPLWT